MYFEYDDITMCFVLLQNGQTPLHRAARIGKVGSIECLLNKGAKIDQVDNVRYLMYILTTCIQCIYCIRMG